jgi:hypothetical protein
MTTHHRPDALSADRARRADPPPWALGPPDPDYGEATRALNHAALTDVRLSQWFERRFPQHRRADYEQMVRALGYVWDCPHDGSPNVTGFGCAVCGRGRAAASG